MSVLPTARHLAACTLNAQHSVTRTWVDDPTRLELLTQQHELDVLLATDLSIAAKRAARFAPGATPEALLNQWIDLETRLSAMMSMRYEDEDPGKPFVDATPLSRPLTVADITAVTQMARDLYGALRPRYVRLWSSQPHGWIPSSMWDKRFMAAQLTPLRAGNGLTVPVELTIVPARSLTRYAEAQRAYEAVRATHQDHPKQATLQSRDDLTETLENGLLFDVMVEQTWAGYVAAYRGGDTLGLPAYVVQELVLAEPMRGQGYGPPLTTLLARAAG
jgi:hypothetical protein